MSSTPIDPPKGIPAATVVVFRNGRVGDAPEILMTVRSHNMVFAGGMAVFPGGRVDPADYRLAQRFAGKLEPDEAAHRIAAIRETLEETGLAIALTGNVNARTALAARQRLLETGALAPVIEEFGWEPDLDRLVPFARWCPMNERVPRIYDTRFYLADLGTGAVDIAADLSENTHLFWTTAQGALDTAARGEIRLIFPTRRNLERLAQFASFGEARVQAQAIPVRTIVPQVDTSGGQPVLRIAADAGYPVTTEALDAALRG